MSKHAPPFLHTWGAPIALGAISLAGLLAALVGDGGWDVASWICLGAVTATCVWYGVLARPGARTGKR